MNQIQWLFENNIRAGACASVLAALIALTATSFRRYLSPSWRCALWTLVLIRLALPDSVQTPLSLLNVPRWVRSASPSPTVSVEYVTHPELSTPPAAITATPLAEALPASVPLALPGHSLSVHGVLACFWLIGSLAMVARLVFANVWLRWRLRRENLGGSSEIDLTLANSAAELGIVKFPQLKRTGAVSSPGLFGCLRPRILLPEQLGLNGEELRHVLLHELSHLKRKDHWMNLAMSILQALHWYNPIVWRVMKQIRIERELACDALVVARSTPAERRAYGETLLKILASVGTRPSLQPVVGIVEERATARFRLQQIAAGGTYRSSRPLALALTVFLAATGLTNAQTEKEKPPGEPIVDRSAGPVRNPPAAEPSQLRTSEPPPDNVPSAKNPGASTSVKVLLADAKLLMEMGKWPEAAEKLRRAKELEPERSETAYFLRAAEEQLEDAARKDQSSRIAANQHRVYLSTNRNAIIQKLRTIALPKFQVAAGTPLNTAVRELSAAVKERDPNKMGVNFLIVNQTLNDPAIGQSVAMIDPRTGQIMPKVDESTVSVEAMQNGSAIDILNALVKFSNYPGGLQYSIEDYAVVFGPKPKAAYEALYTRTYKLDPNRVAKHLEIKYGSSGEVLKALRSRLGSLGVSLEGQEPASDGEVPRKAIFYNDRTGILMVRTTLQELDLIESLVQTINFAPPQVSIETQVFQLLPGDAYETDLLLRQLLRSNRGGLVATATEIMSYPEFQKVITALNNGSRLAQAAIDSPYTRAVGILTESQTGDVLIGFRNSEGVRLTTPIITTLSGRQARVSIDPGSTVDILPVVRADGKSIRLEGAIDVPADKRFAAMSARGTAVLWDGQTMILLTEEGRGRTVVAFITPTIIDPAGNRIHSPETLPDPNTFPLETPE